MKTNYQKRIFCLLSAAILDATATSTYAVPSCNVHATITPGNQSVAAITGGAATVVTLDGSGSKITPGNVDPTSCAWAQISGSPTVTLTNANTCTASFPAPNVPSGVSLGFRLTVTGTGCIPVTVTNDTTIGISYVDVNQAPEAKISVSSAPIHQDGFIHQDDLVTLDGKGSSDPDGDTITAYSWEQIKINPTDPDVTLNGANTDTAAFTAPNPYPANGVTLKFKLTVSDGSLAGTAEKEVNVVWENEPPVAAASCPSSVDEGATFTLDGTGSTDPDDGIASYLWSQTSGGPVPTDWPIDPSTESLTLTAPSLTSPLDTMSFKLEVTDIGGLMSSDECDVKVNDITPPTAAPSQSPVANGEGWNNTDVVVDWNWIDAGVGIDNANCITTTNSSIVPPGEGALTLNATCKDLAGNNGSASKDLKIDKTQPTISAAATPAPNVAGWYKSNVTVHFTCDDAISGIAGSCPDDQILSSEGAAAASTAQTVADKAGNTSDPSNVVTVKIDKTAPGITWNGGISDGGIYYFGSVPSTPTCDATDTLSGPKDCGVTGYSAALGTHTLKATAHDFADNQTVETSTYTVNAWTLNGFYQPVDMGGVWNTVKGGSTVPLKFEVFAGTTELTDVAVVDSFIIKGVTCPGGSEPTADIELTTTGGTSLRYDSVAGQFIQNWQTPKKSGACYEVTMKTDDSSHISALFKLK